MVHKNDFFSKSHTLVKLNKKFLRKIVFSLLIIFSISLGAQKNRLIERVLLSTHNICFG